MGRCHGCRTLSDLPNKGRASCRCATTACSWSALACAAWMAAALLRFCGTGESASAPAEMARAAAACSRSSVACHRRKVAHLT